VSETDTIRIIDDPQLMLVRVERYLDECKNLEDLSKAEDKIDALAEYARKEDEPRPVVNALVLGKIEAMRRAGGLVDGVPKEQGKRTDLTSDQSDQRLTQQQHLIKIYTWPRVQRWNLVSLIPQPVYRAEREALLRIQCQRWATQTIFLSLGRKELNNGKKPVSLPEGQYQVIEADPPWPIDRIMREVRPYQPTELDYPKMTIQAIKDFTLPAADDTHVFLWTTERFLPISFEVLLAWKVKYSCTFVWHKAGGIQPHGLPQFNCEFCVYGRIGSPEFRTTKGLKTCFAGKRRGHSIKPQEFYDMITPCTDGPRIRLFSRQVIEGWDGWGNEYPSE